MEFVERDSQPSSAERAETRRSEKERPEGSRDQNASAADTRLGIATANSVIAFAAVPAAHANVAVGEDVFNAGAGGKCWY